ncbi:MAG TPA: hypothetical protein VKU40_02835, partial [Thermoanaerobaculia bacterium]|nr:hypothetical protein [Thermoanaerobaculia bacterium]
MTDDRASDERPLEIERFLDEPTRDLGEWRRLWREDLAFPTRSGRGGPIVRLFKKLLSPFVKLPLGAHHDRQAVFNQIVLEHLERLDALGREQREHHDRLDAFVREALDEALDHNDALYARADQKLDRYRAEAAELTAALGAALAVDGDGSEAPAAPT